MGRCATVATGRVVFYFNPFNLFNLCNLCTALHSSACCYAGRQAGTLQWMKAIRNAPLGSSPGLQDVRPRKWRYYIGGLLIVQRRATMQRTMMVHPNLDTLSPPCYHPSSHLLPVTQTKSFPVETFPEKGKSNAILYTSTERLFLLFHPFR